MTNTPLQWNALARPRDTAVALGNFDGVHVGHRRALESLRAHAVAHDLEPVALTFDPHPRQYFIGPEQGRLLTPPGEKEALIAQLGVTPVTLRFDAGLAAMAAEDFISEVLLGRLRGRAFFLGPNHRFGQGALGDAALLRRVTTHPANQSPASIHEVDPVRLDGKVVSSSAIRRLLEEGDVEGTARMLGRPYSLTGTVAGGSGRGRLLGFPTANLDTGDPRKIIPAFGVYGGVATFGGTSLPAVANLGMRPTFGGTAPALEVHVLDWEGDLYGKPFEFGILRRLRPEKRFESPEALRAQILADVEEWQNFAKSADILSRGATA
jgi:riboflavin kinase / FMN adenylyltransferase